MAAELVLEALDGQVPGTGQSVVDMRNINAEPINMRPLICGKDAKAYVAEREEAYPLGLDGQPSYLDGRVRRPESIARPTSASIRDVPLPRPRPAMRRRAAAATN